MMRDPVLLSETARVDQTARWLQIAEREPEVNARARRGLDLREHMLTVEGDDGLARTRLYIRSERQPEREQLFVNRALKQPSDPRTFFPPSPLDHIVRASPALLHAPPRTTRSLS